MRALAAIKATIGLMVRPEARHNALHEWRRRLAGEPRLPPPPLHRVLVTCHGNICRSPFAAALLARALPEREVRSVGLTAAEGDPADPTARRVARRWGVDLEAHRTRRITADDVGWAHLILGMEGHHVALLCQRFPDAGSKGRLLGHFLPSPPYTIADPWGGSESVFEQTFERIAAAAERLAALAKENALTEAGVDQPSGRRVITRRPTRG